MNIVNRPMVFSALFCSVVAAVSLFSKVTAAILAVLFLAFILIFVFRKNYKYITVLLFVFLFITGLVFQFFKIEKLNNFDNKKISGSFLVIEETTYHGTYNSVRLKNIDCTELPNNTKILLYDNDKHALNTGDIFYATIKVSVIDKYNEYRNSRYGEGIYLTASLENFDKVTGFNRFYKTSGDIRQYVRGIISDKFNGDTAGLLLALTTGDKSLLSDKFLGNVKTTGISHVIVVSGMHLAIIMSAIFFIIDKMFYNKYIRCLISTLFVISIIAICGFTMSVIRAGVMFVIVAIAPLLKRDNDSLSALLTAGTIILTFSPFAVFNVSFQLSFLSTFSIVWILPFIERFLLAKFNVNNKTLNSICSVLFSSVSAILFTLPVIIKVFGYVSIISPITNLLITFPVTIALIVNMIAVILSAIPMINVISYPLFWLSGFCSKTVIYIVNSLAKLPITVAVLPKSLFWVSVAIIVCLIIFVQILSNRKKGLNANGI